MLTGILVFPGVQQLDLTGPFEVFGATPVSARVVRDGPLIMAGGVTAGTISP